MRASLVDNADLETFLNHLVDSFPELFTVAEALFNLLIEGCKMVPSSRYMNFMKNLTGKIGDFSVLLGLTFRSTSRSHRSYMPVKRKFFFTSTGNLPP